MKKALSISVFSVALAANSASGMPILQGGTETATGSTYNSNFMQGYDFTATANTSLTALGFWDSNADGLGRRFQVGLWNTSTTSLLASVFIDDGDALDTSLTIENGQYRYETLASAVALTSGTTYTLAWQMGASLGFVDSLFLNSAGLVENPLTDTLNPTVRFLPTSSFSFPTNTGAVPGFFRANVNAIVGDSSRVPTPATIALFGFGLAGLAFTRRKLKL